MNTGFSCMVCTGLTLQRIMLAKSWNYDFMDARIMLAESSHYALEREIHFVVLMEPQRSEKCAFSYLQVAHGHTQYTEIEYPQTKVSMHARDQHRKEKTLHYFLYSLDDKF